MHVCFVVYVLAIQYLAKRFSEMTYFVSGWTQNLNPINICPLAYLNNQTSKFH